MECRGGMRLHGCIPIGHEVLGDAEAGRRWHVTSAKLETFKTNSILYILDHLYGTGHSFNYI